MAKTRSSDVADDRTGQGDKADKGDMAGPQEIDRHAWVALAITTLVAFLVVVDVSVVNVAFPSIRADLGASDTALAWIISGYNISVATFLLISGRLADSLGRKRVFLPGVVVFMIGSLASGLAPNVELLIAARVLQAVGGAILMPASLAVVLPEFPFSRRSMAIGVWGAMGSLGAAFGPALGSLLINIGGWRYIFLINVPICVIVFVTGRRSLRESSDPAATGRMDLIGVPVGTVSVALLMLAIIQGESWGLTDGRTIGLVIAGLALLPILIWRSARHPEPLLQLDLFRSRTFSATSIGVSLYSMAFTAGFLLNSLLLQDLWDLSVVQTGLALSPAPILASIVSVPAGRWADRFGHRWLLGLGSSMCGASFLWYRLVLGAEPAVWTWFLVGSLALGLGVGLSIASWFSAAVSDVNPARFGVANATLRTIQQVFYAVGISVVIALLASTVDTDQLLGFQRGWTWAFVMYFASAAVIMTRFPSGSSTQRSAQ